MEANLSHDKIEFELICVIVNYGLGSKVLKIAKQNGVLGGTIFLGKGTVKNRLLELLDLCDVRKEIVLMVAEKTVADKALAELSRTMKFDKPNHGVAFATAVLGFIGAVGKEYSDNEEGNIERKNGGAASTMYNAIYVIVDRGKAESVIDAATEAGSRGGTIINARGSGIHETGKLFAMEIEPEKEIVLILSEEHLTEAITSSIRKNLAIDEPGNGVIFIQNVNQAYGLY